MTVLPAPALAVGQALGTLPLAVGVEDSSSSGWAVDWAARQAAAGDVALLLVAGVGSPTTASPDRPVARGERALTRARERVELLTPDVETARVLSYAEPVPALLAALSGARVAVTGAAAGDGTACFSLVSRGLVAAATRPVVVVPATPARRHEGRTVVGVRDGRELERFLRWADAVALPGGGTLELTHAAGAQPDGGLADALREAAYALAARGLATDVVIVPGRATDVLADRAAGADLVALGGSRTSLRVATHLISRAACPLAFLPEEGS